MRIVGLLMLMWFGSVGVCEAQPTPKPQGKTITGKSVPAPTCNFSEETYKQVFIITNDPDVKFASDPRVANIQKEWPRYLQEANACPTKNPLSGPSVPSLLWQFEAQYYEAKFNNEAFFTNELVKQADKQRQDCDDQLAAAIKRMANTPRTVITNVAPIHMECAGDGQCNGEIFLPSTSLPVTPLHMTCRSSVGGFQCDGALMP